jgi:hypothetical protein
MEKEYVPFDLIDVGLAFWVGASPTVAGVLCLLAQYTVRHNDEVREAIVGGAQKALPSIREKALTARSFLGQQEQLAQGQQPAPPTPQETAPPTPPADTDQGVLDTLAGKHHLLVVGHTGGGKSVLLHNLAKRLSGTANVLVCDVDSVRGTYQGYRVVGAGDDYDAISKALQLVRVQVGKRREARAAGTRSFKAMWVFIDEAHDVFANVENARELFIDIVRRGRKLNIHAAIGTQDSLVKTLGLEGQSKALVNLTRVDVTTRGQQRTASIDGNEYPVPDLPHPDDMVQPDQRPTPPAQQPNSPDQTTPNQANNDLLATLLGGGSGQFDGKNRPTTDQGANQSTNQANRSANQSTNQANRSANQADWYQMIRDKRAAGMSKNKIWEWLRDQQITRNKTVALRMIEEAENEETNGSGSGLLGNYLGDRTEEEL